MTHPHHQTAAVATEVKPAVEQEQPGPERDHDNDHHVRGVETRGRSELLRRDRYLRARPGLEELNQLQPVGDIRPNTGRPRTPALGGLGQQHRQLGYPSVGSARVRGHSAYASSSCRTTKRSFWSSGRLCQPSVSIPGRISPVS